MPFPVTVLLDRDAPSETFIRREIDLLRQRGWTLHVRYLTGDGAIQSRAPCSHGMGHTASMFPRSPLAALRILKRLPQAAAFAHDLRDTQSRVVWAQFAGVTADIAGIAAAALNLPWLCSVHAHDVFTARRNVLACRLRDARRIIACSQAAADAVLASGVARERVEVIHHGVALPEHIPHRQECLCHTIFSAGRLEPKKGFDVLLRACALLHARNVPFTCRIAGQGSQEAELRRLAEGLGITFLGWLAPEQVLDEIRAASVVALASRRLPDGDRDGIANILLEALAAGTPVVTTTAGAAAEVIQDNVNGRLVPPDDPAALAAALTDTLASCDTRQRFAAAGRRTIAETFDPDANIRKLETCLKELEIRNCLSTALPLN
ncbi:MAG: glycosyltransferase family 4 protein [Kiritimatiellaeota bacterium]|nr:glycosyltransferase family 4 protein [Kiritimatiellota bacterium]